MIAAASIITILALFACSSGETPPVGSAERGANTKDVSVTTVPPSPADERTPIPKLEDRLAQIVAAYRSGDTAQLQRLADGSVDLKDNSVRVIMEMEISPEAHAVSGPTTETLTLADGRTVQIQHAPAIAIRSDLAQAIAATGATYETAYANSVQVRAPIDSLEGLARIAGVHYVRLPLPAQR